MQIVDFLSTVIISNDFIYLDYWSVIHLIAGFIVMGLILDNKVGIKNSRKTPFVILFLLLVSFEIKEAFIYNNPQIFGTLIQPETNLDVLWDLIIGMLGGKLRKT